MIAVVVVRDAALPAGADEAVAEVGGTAIVIGTGAAVAAKELTTARWATALEAGPFDAAAYAAALAARDEVRASRIVLPSSPDGRDLAPHLALALGVPLFAGAVRVAPDRLSLVRTQGRVAEELAPPEHFVATLVPGVRGAEPVEALPYPSHQVEQISTVTAPGVRSTEVLPPDPTTMDLAEAPRIVAGGQGIGAKEGFDLLGAVGERLGASLGGTRVATDAGWIPFERQIGTTGVTVQPRLYLSFAISGATQHTSGLGDPDHIVSVNLDASCPMMAMADLALVSDANAVIAALARRLGVDAGDAPKR